MFLVYAVPIPYTNTYIPILVANMSTNTVNTLCKLRKVTPSQFYLHTYIKTKTGKILQMLCELFVSDKTRVKMKTVIITL